MEESSSGGGLGDWLQWQVLLCAFIIILPTATAFILVRRRRRNNVLLVNSAADLWLPCWRNLHPRWLLLYRAFAFAAMAYFLYQTVATFGSFVFFFYTQWTFVLVMVYFAVATVVSIQGCRIHSREPLSHDRERERILKKDTKDVNRDITPTSEQQLGFLGNISQIIYLTCAGAVLLTDIVFWCLLLPFMTGENFKLTLLLGIMHSVNALFLLIDSLLNRMPFPWFGIVYFIFWSAAYVVFQWSLHACCLNWWPYPFLDLSTPWAPLWYLSLALFHILCYGLYVLLMKGKDTALSRMFPHTFIRVSTEKKHD